MNRHLKFVISGVLLIALLGGASLFHFSRTAMNEKKGVTDSLGAEALEAGQISESDKDEIILGKNCHQIVAIKKTFFV
jgi:hypothetical protein